MRTERKRGPWSVTFRHEDTEYTAEFYVPRDRRDGVEDVCVEGVDEPSDALQEAAEQAAQAMVDDARAESRTNYGAY